MLAASPANFVGASATLPAATPRCTERFVSALRGRRNSRLATDDTDRGPEETPGHD
jgi:hypothetical protein